VGVEPLLCRAGVRVQPAGLAVVKRAAGPMNGEGQSMFEPYLIYNKGCLKDIFPSHNILHGETAIYLVVSEAQQANIWCRVPPDGSGFGPGVSWVSFIFHISRERNYCPRWAFHGPSWWRGSHRTSS
jgi:hypothetical protein